MNITKNPSIRASVDWVKSLIVFNKEELDEDFFEKTLTIAIKNEDEWQKVLENIKLK